MNIIEAIKIVLSNTPLGLTTEEIYDKIIERGLYTFSCQNPLGFINSQVRKRCENLDFPTAFPLKSFRISGYQGKKCRFSLSNSQQNFCGYSDNEQGYHYMDELLPEEKLDIALKEHIASVKQQMRMCIFKSPPNYFMNIVVELLLKMGYGEKLNIEIEKRYGRRTEGVIMEDKLGLDLIYIQTECYSPEKPVGCKDVQAFIGAMNHIQKGVYITNSKFTRNAIEFVKTHHQKKVKLIDGNLLVELLFMYQVGVSQALTLPVYKIELDYFNL